MASKRTEPFYSKYRDNPVGYAIDILGISPWSRQIGVLQAVAEHDKTATRSGHKVGKSTSCAILALWWFDTRERALVVMTSSTDGQIKEILWPELTRLYNGAKKPIGGTLHDSHRSGLRAADGIRRVVGISTNTTENMGGFSGAELLFIADEASGIDEGIFKAIEGNRAGGARLAMFGNPTKMSGTFFDAFHDKIEFWFPIHISSEETPNVTGIGDAIPGLATKEYIEEKRREYGGPGDPEWDIRIGGNFPAQGEHSVIGIGLYDAAIKDWTEPTLVDGRLELGVDVARYGDDETVIYPRRGLRMYPSIVMRGKDGEEVAAEVMRVVHALRAPSPPGIAFLHPADSDASIEKPRIKVDGTGGYGASVIDHLKPFRGEVEVVEINVSESATNEKYFRLRDQLWFAVKDWLKEGGKMQHDAKLRGELIATTYHVEPRGQLRVSSKDEIKAQLSDHRSPDRADAMALAIYNPPQPFVGSVEVDWMSR